MWNNLKSVYFILEERKLNAVLQSVIVRCRAFLSMFFLGFLPNFGHLSSNQILKDGFPGKDWEMIQRVKQTLEEEKHGTECLLCFGDNQYGVLSGWIYINQGWELPSRSTPRNPSFSRMMSFHSCPMAAVESPSGLLLLLSRFSRVWLWATPETAAHQAPLSLGFSRQEHWSGLPFPSPVPESEKWKSSCSVVSTLSDPMDCSPPGSSTHGVFQARVLEWGAIAFSTFRASLWLITASSHLELPVSLLRSYVYSALWWITVMTSVLTHQFSFTISKFRWQSQIKLNSSECRVMS